MTSDTTFSSQVAAAANGEEWAWSSLHRDYAARVRGYLAARGLPEPDEGVGDVFVNVARALPAFEGGRSAFEVLLFTMARRLVDDDPRQLTGPTSTGGAQPIHVTSVLDQLEVPEREALLLRMVGGLPPEQVAGVLGVSADEVERLTRRALGSLSQVLF